MIDTLDGMEKVVIQPGSQQGDTIRIRHKGVYSLYQKRGDMIVQIAVNSLDLEGAKG